MRSYASSQKHSSPSREAFAIPPLCWRCVQWDSSRRAENTAGWQRCRNRYQLVWLLDCARTAAIQPGLWRNQCGFSAGGRLVQFGAALGAAPPASAEWHAFAQVVAFVDRGAAPSAVFARQAGWRPRACGPCENARRNMPWIRASRDSVLWLNENVTSTQDEHRPFNAGSFC
jgi:hypothetical protein